MLHKLQKYVIKHGVYHPLLAVDIENDPKTGAFICAGVYGEVKRRVSVRHGTRVTTTTDNEIIEHYSTDINAFHEFILSIPKGAALLIFYNLPYDKVYFDGIIAPPSLSRAGSVKSSVLTIGTRVITMTLKNGLKCMDLFNHTMYGSLEDWGAFTKCPIQKAALTDYKNRVMNDAKITFHVGKFLQDFYYNECQIPMQLTVGASALKLFTARFFTDLWERDDDFLSTFERQSYYGGRTELFIKGDLHHFSYDIGSTYLSVMRDELLPDMSSGYYVADGYDWRAKFDNALGIFHCRVRVPPDTYIPLLPVRIDKKLKFPTGEFDGIWTNIELRRAEREGAHILTCYDYVTYKRAKPYFAEFAAFVWDRREAYTKAGNKGMNDMIKRVGNSLYGKFAQRNSTEIFCRLSEYPGLIPDGAELLEYRNETWILTHGDAIPALFEFPAIASFIASYARVKLFDGMRANADTLIYTDTDSIKLTAPAIGIDIGSGLGQWKFEGENQGVFYRPKFYCDKHKGVPKRAILVEETSEYKRFRFERPTREREAIRRNLVPNQWLTHEKTLSFLDDKRLWKNNQSKPINYLDKQQNA